jgi:hypothetical protein
MDKTLLPASGCHGMRPSPPAPRTLLLIAAVAVLAMAAISDFQPARANSLAEIADEPADLSAIIVRCRPCNGGFLFNLTDGEGGWADAFCPQEICPVPLANGTSARLVLERSISDPNFFYVQEMIVVATPTGND